MSDKMIEVKLQLTEEEHEMIRDMAEGRDVTLEFVIEKFVADLACSNRSNGSDERDLADRWWERNNYNW